MIAAIVMKEICPVLLEGLHKNIPLPAHLHLLMLDSAKRHFMSFSDSCPL